MSSITLENKLQQDMTIGLQEACNENNQWEWDYRR